MFKYKLMLPRERSWVCSGNNVKRTKTELQINKLTNTGQNMLLQFYVWKIKIVTFKFQI